MSPQYLWVTLTFFLLSACQSSPGSPPSLTPLDETADGPSNEEIGLNPHLDLSLNDDDKAAALRALNRAYLAPLSQAVTWKNPDTGHSGKITALRDGYTANGSYCREFQQTITIEGQHQQKYSKACQQPNGTWVNHE